MKKILLLLILAVSLNAGATIYVFDVIPTPTATAAPYPLSCIYGTSPDFIYNVTTLADDNFISFAYTATNVTPGAALTFSYKDSQASADAGKKGLAFKNSEKAFIFDGTKRKLKVSGLTIGDAIQFSIGSKGSTAHTFTVTGATASTGNPALTAKPADSYVYVTWNYTATATEAIFEVATGGCIVNSIRTGTDILTGTKSVLADKGVSLSGNEIVNSQKQSLEVYNVLGKKVISSNENVSLKDFQKGIYIVRVAGSNDALKFSI